MDCSEYLIRVFKTKLSLNYEREKLQIFGENQEIQNFWWKFTGIPILEVASSKNIFFFDLLHFYVNIVKFLSLILKTPG